MAHGMTLHHPYKQAGFPLCVCVVPFSCAPNTWQDLWRVGVELSPEQMGFCGNFLSKWNFVEILFGRLLAKIAEYLLNGSLREVKFHTPL
jgi:hypothetical protein